MKNQTLTFIAILMGLTAQAQETTKKENDSLHKKGESLSEVIVVGNKETKTVSALRSGLKTIDTPQSIQIIDSETIKQQQSIRLSEIIKNANGVYVGSARGGSQETFWSRGYSMSSNNMFKNGFRFNGNDVPEVSSLEKVEFLKGSAALLYGNVTPGGILNMVTKTPSFTKGGEFSMQAGSFAFYKPSIDIYGPLSNDIAFRFIGSYEDAESFRDQVISKRFYFNPSFLFKVNDKTQITLQGDYLDNTWTPDFGTGVIGKVIADVPRNSYFGTLWDNGNTKTASVSALLNHEINTNWKVNFNASYQNYDRGYKGVQRIQPNDEDDEVNYGDWNRALGENKNLEKIFGDQFSLQGKFNTGKIKHEVFTGVDFEYSFAQAYTFTFDETYYDQINLFDFDPSTQRNDEPESTITKLVNTDTNTFGVYAQDLISLTDQFKVLLGIRWTLQEAKVDTYSYTNNTLTETPVRTDKAFTPKAGIVYQPTKSTTLFASYANSFTPNSGTTVDLENIEASIIDQFEVGVKKDFWKGLLSTNVTLYQITNDNLAETAAYTADGAINTDTSIKSLAGATKSKGVEIDITARPIKGLSINAGYSYNDMRYTKTSESNGSYIEGDRLARTPATTANASFFYTLPSGKLKGLSLGSIANYIGDRTGGWNDRYVVDATTGEVTIEDRDIPINGYTTIDVSAGYTWKKFTLLCKLSNIANVLNYTVHENYSINPIAPRQFMANLNYKF